MPRFPIYILLVTLTVFTCASVVAQPVYQHKHFGMHDGLSNDEVTSIVQDKQDFIWIGTRGGLNRYDGHEFTSYQKEEGGLSSSAIETLFVDSRGKLWIGTQQRSRLALILSQKAFHIILSKKATLPMRVSIASFRYLKIARELSGLVIIVGGSIEKPTTVHLKITSVNWRCEK